MMLAASCALVLAAGCGSTDTDSSSQASAGGESSDCQITEPADTDAPEGVQDALDGLDYGAFGKDALWVDAWWTDQETLDEARSGELSDDPDEYPYQMKYPSYTVRKGAVVDEMGAPEVEVERLDGDGEANADTGGFATATNDDGTDIHWWPTVIAFSDHGCWQVTETVKDTSISYTFEL